MSLNRLLLATLFLASTALAMAQVSGPADRSVTEPRSVSSTSRATSGPVKVADLMQTTALAGATLSPDGARIAYTGNASGRFNLWVMNTDGSAPHQLIKSNDRQAGEVFTRDGREIVYMQDTGGDELYDLYAVPVAGGEPHNITHTDTISETGPRFSPDGAMLAFESKLKSAPGSDIAVMPWPSGPARLLTHESNPKASWGVIAFSPDGKTLYADRSVGTDDSDIYRIEIASAKAENLTAHSGHEEIGVSDISPDGRTLLGSSNRKGGFANVGLFDIATRQWKWITDTQWEASSGVFSLDAKSFTYQMNIDGRRSLLFVDVATGKASTRNLPVGLNSPGAGPIAFAPDGSYYFAHQDSTHAANLFVIKPGGVISQITHNESPALAAASLPTSQLVTYKSFDGKLISAFVWVPFNLKRDGTAPAVVLPHGGPTGQVSDSFNRAAILLASRGFIAIAPNVRGSTGYGMDFQKANFKDLGGGDLKDEIAGVDFLKATGFIDPRKVGIWGGSYGGYMTLMAIGKTPAVWAAAVDEYGILNWLTMLEHEDPRLQEYEKTLLGDPIADRAVYEASSPLKYIRNERAPLLVLQGERDIRVPKEEAEQVVSILKAEGRTVDSVVYAEEGHGFIKREHQIDEYTRAIAWLQLYLQGKSN